MLKYISERSIFRGTFSPARLVKVSFATQGTLEPATDGNRGLCAVHVRSQRDHVPTRKAHAHKLFASASHIPPLKAAVLIIGNEILSGSVVDTNTPWLTKLLYNQGVDLVRVECIPDDKPNIISTIRRLKDTVGQAGVIFSSGGIGPTHDDITYEALAEAFDVKLEEDEGTVRLMRENYDKRGVELNASRLRMATLPTPSEILRTPGLWVPLVNLQGVYILPGIPRLFRQMVEAHKDRFQGPGAWTSHLLTNWSEGDLAEQLAKVAADHKDVTIGSYINTEGGKEYAVKVSLSSRSQTALQAAEAAIQDTIDIVQ